MPQPKVELQVLVNINGRAIWMRSKTIAPILTVALPGSDYDKVVTAAEEQLEELCRKASDKAPPKKK